MSGRPDARAAVKVHLGLGSNQGDREGILRAAVLAMLGWSEVHSLVTSRLYETAYVGPGEQAPYLNACVRMLTTLPPDELHSRTRALERGAGRSERGHMQPRPLDIDLLLYGDTCIEASGLKIPHPRMRDRQFVLEPLLELSPDLRHPEDGRPFREDLDQAEVRAQAMSLFEAPGWQTGSTSLPLREEGQA